MSGASSSGQLLSERPDRRLRQGCHQLEVLAATDREIGPRRAEVGDERRFDRKAVEPDLGAAPGHLGDPLELDEQTVADVTTAANPRRHQLEALADPGDRGELGVDPGTLLIGQLVAAVEQQAQPRSRAAQRSGDQHQVARHGRRLGAAPRRPPACPRPRRR